MSRLYLDKESMKKLTEKFDRVFLQKGMEGVEALLPSMGEATRIKYKVWKDLIEAKKVREGNTITIEQKEKVPVSGDYSVLEKSLKDR